MVGDRRDVEGLGGPLREKNFRWYFASRFVNTLGNMMANVALAFAVLEITDSATALGQVLAAPTIPLPRAELPAEAVAAT